MCVYRNHPVIFGLVNAVFLVPCSNARLSLHQCSCIGFAFQNPLYRTFVPPLIADVIVCVVHFLCFLILVWWVDAPAVQFIGNRSIAFGFNKFLIDELYNTFRILVRQQHPALSLPLCLIPVWRRTAYIGTFLSPLLQMQLRLFGKILCIHIIYKVFDFRSHLLIFISLFPSVKAVCNRNKPHSQKRKYFFNIIACLQIVPAKP